MRRAKPRREASDTSPFDADLGRRAPLRILLVEDNATNRKVALRLLQRVGYEADHAENGLEALTAMEHAAYDVVLMDVQMPEMDGLEATRQIRRRWNVDRQPRIIAITANAMPGDRELCLTAGMDDYVAKPIQVGALIDALQKCEPLVAPPAAVKPAPAAPDRPSPAATLDPAALENLREIVGGEVAFLAELIDTFLEDAPKLMADMREAVRVSDAAGLRLVSHSLKSNGADFGAGAFAALCQQLEILGKEETVEGAGTLLERVEAECERVRLALTSVRDA